MEIEQQNQKDIYKQKPAASELQVHEKWWKQTYRQQNSPSQHTSETGKEGKPRKSST